VTTYVQPTMEEILAVVASTKSRKTPIPSTNPTKEKWFDWQLPHVEHGPHLAIRWYTSVVEKDGLARGCGKDAMRVGIVKSPTSKNERVIFALTRVHRTPGWQDRVKDRIKTAYLLVRDGPKCPACKARMTPKAARSKDRKKVLRLFWSCSRYPDCKGTRNGCKGKDPKKLLDL